MLLLAKANKIIDLSDIGKLSNLCFCLPGQTKSLILLTLASSQIYAFACQGKQNHFVFLHSQALKSMLLPAHANKIMDSHTLASSQIDAFACHGEQHH